MQKVKIAIFAKDIDTAYKKAQEIVNQLHIYPENESGSRFHRTIVGSTAVISALVFHGDSHRGMKYHKLYVHDDLADDDVLFLKRGLLRWENKAYEEPYRFN